MLYIVVGTALLIAMAISLLPMPVLRRAFLGVISYAVYIVAVGLFFVLAGSFFQPKFAPQALAAALEPMEAFLVSFLPAEHPQLGYSYLVLSAAIVVVMLPLAALLRFARNVSLSTKVIQQFRRRERRESKRFHSLQAQLDFIAAAVSPDLAEEKQQPEQIREPAAEEDVPHSFQISTVGS